MMKINSLSILIFSTVVSIFTMVFYSNYINNPKYYEGVKSQKRAVVGHNKDYIVKETLTYDNQVKEVDEKNSNTKNYLEKKDLVVENNKEDEKSSDNSNVNTTNRDVKKNNWSSDAQGDVYMLKSSDDLENFNYNTKEQEQSVFKVSTGKIQENLTTSDKTKLLYVSLQLGIENYKKVEQYLYAEDAEGGVLKALKLLKEDLSIKEYEKVRKIAEKFIDMDAAERLK